MKLFRNAVPAVAAVFLVAACEGGGGEAPPPEPPKPDISVQMPKSVLVETSEGYYWGTIINDQPLASPQPGGDQPQPSGDQPKSVAKDEPPPSTPAKPALGAYRVDTPVAFRFANEVKGEKFLGVSPYGEVVLAKQVGSDNESLDSRVSVGQPGKGIADRVTVLQNKTQPLFQVFYDGTVDQLVIVHTDKDGVKKLRRRQLGDGKEEDIVELYKAINWRPFKGKIVVTADDADNKVNVMDISTKEAKPLCSKCKPNKVWGLPLPDYGMVNEYGVEIWPIGEFIRFFDGEAKVWKLATTDLSKSWNLTNAPAGASDAVPVADIVRYLKASNEVIFRRHVAAPAAADQEPVVTTELNAIDLGSGTIKTLVGAKLPVSADFKTGSKKVAIFKDAVANNAGKYLLYGGDWSCAAADECEQIAWRYSWLLPDGKVEQVAQYDWPADFVTYSADGNRLVLETVSDVGRVIVLDASSGKELASLNRAFVPAVEYAQLAAADVRQDWEEGKYFLTMRETGEKDEYELGVMGLHQVDALKEGDTLKPDVITKVQGILYAVRIWDSKAAKTRPAPVVADTTPVPEKPVEPPVPPTPILPPIVISGFGPANNTTVAPNTKVTVDNVIIESTTEAPLGKIEAVCSNNIKATLTPAAPAEGAKKQTVKFEVVVPAFTIMCSIHAWLGGGGDGWSDYGDGWSDYMTITVVAPVNTAPKITPANFKGTDVLPIVKSGTEGFLGTTNVYYAFIGATKTAKPIVTIEDSDAGDSIASLKLSCSANTTGTWKDLSPTKVAGSEAKYNMLIKYTSSSMCVLNCPKKDTLETCTVTATDSSGTSSGLKLNLKWQ